MTDQSMAPVEDYPEAPKGFESVAYAADTALADVLWLIDSRIDDERDVKEINRLAA